METIELFIADEAKDGVFAVSLVEEPAIEEDFVALSTDRIELKVADEERKVVVGLALVPEKKIYRFMKGKEFNIFFSKDTISKAQELYMKKLNLNNVTAEHEEKVTGASVIESWIVEDSKNDKTNLYNLKATEGSWAIMMKIDNEELWSKVKSGEFKGFSIEGIFGGFEQLEASKDKDIVEQIKELIDGTQS
jgi:hypothetical protein